MATVLLIESTRANGSSFAPQLNKHYQILRATTGKAALPLLSQHPPQVVVVDARMMRTSGDRLCASLRSQLPNTPLIHIRPATPAAEEGIPSCADVLLPVTVSYRKLYNRIQRYVAASNASHLLKVGGMTLNTALDVLTSATGEQKLTPKVAQLLSIFMRHVGQVVDRRVLIHEVWHTDYMGDTRTLDVHIRWLRQAIEPQPNTPQVLKTVRGKGYIFQPLS
jgi:DNA-binding response OmpR family regulator